MATPYTDRIASIAPKHDPRHIEAFMRSQFSTLDHLSAAEFRREVKIAAQCVDLGGASTAEDIAKSFGL